MLEEIVIRKLINEILEAEFDEERIPNPEAPEYIKKRENFVGSHTYGEDLGDLDRMYVAYSYGEQHPLFVWIDKGEFNDMRPNDSSSVNVTRYEKMGADGKKLEKEGVWFYNSNDYYVPDPKNPGKLKVNKWTRKHRKDLKPTEKVQARDTKYLDRLISDFKVKYKIGDNSHGDLEPGEK